MEFRDFAFERNLKSLSSSGKPKKTKNRRTFGWIIVVMSFIGFFVFFVSSSLKTTPAKRNILVNVVKGKELLSSFVLIDSDVLGVFAMPSEIILESSGDTLKREFRKGDLIHLLETELAVKIHSSTNIQLSRLSGAVRSVKGEIFFDRDYGNVFFPSRSVDYVISGREKGWRRTLGIMAIVGELVRLNAVEYENVLGCRPGDVVAVFPYTVNSADGYRAVGIQSDFENLVSAVFNRNSDREVKVQVLNASGDLGKSGEVAEILRSSGIDVVDVDSVSFTADRTVILERSGVLSKAFVVKNALGKGEVVFAPAPSLLVDVTVLVGRDF